MQVLIPVGMEKTEEQARVLLTKRPSEPSPKSRLGYEEGQVVSTAVPELPGNSWAQKWTLLLLP